DAPLDVEPPGVVRMLLEAAGEAVGHEARRVDRILDAHPEDGVIQEHLQHPLRLQVSTRRAERHDELSRPDGERRVRGEAWPLARRQARGMTGNGERLRPAR